MSWNCQLIAAGNEANEGEPARKRRGTVDCTRQKTGIKQSSLTSMAGKTGPRHGSEASAQGEPRVAPPPRRIGSIVFGSRTLTSDGPSLSRTGRLLPVRKTFSSRTPSAEGFCAQATQASAASASKTDFIQDLSVGGGTRILAQGRRIQHPRAGCVPGTRAAPGNPRAVGQRVTLHARLATTTAANSAVATITPIVIAVSAAPTPAHASSVTASQPSHAPAPPQAMMAMRLGMTFTCRLTRRRRLQYSSGPFASRLGLLPYNRRSHLTGRMLEPSP